MYIHIVLYYQPAVELSTVFSRCTLILYCITTMYINLVLYYQRAVELRLYFCAFIHQWNPVLLSPSFPYVCTLIQYSIASMYINMVLYLLPCTLIQYCIISTPFSCILYFLRLFKNIKKAVDSRTVFCGTLLTSYHYKNSFFSCSIFQNVLSLEPKYRISD